MRIPLPFFVLPLGASGSCRTLEARLVNCAVSSFSAATSIAEPELPNRRMAADLIPCLPVRFAMPTLKECGGRALRSRKPLPHGAFSAYPTPVASLKTFTTRLESASLDL